jgi:hypothetical protein
MSDLFAGYIDGRPELKRQFGITSDRTVERWEAKGLPVIRLGRKRLYPVRGVRAWIATHLHQGDPDQSGPSNRQA